MVEEVERRVKMMEKVTEEASEGEMIQQINNKEKEKREKD